MIQEYKVFAVGVNFDTADKWLRKSLDTTRSQSFRVVTRNASISIFNYRST